MNVGPESHMTFTFIRSLGNTLHLSEARLKKFNRSCCNRIADDSEVDNDTLEGVVVVMNEPTVLRHTHPRLSNPASSRQPTPPPHR